MTRPSLSLPAILALASIGVWLAVVGAVAMVSPARIAQVSEAAPLDWAGD
ncbi:hypothetical protein [Paracraurococcus ruber]|nr:hypothetical protein [Paracraurococcus ruber]